MNTKKHVTKVKSTRPKRRRAIRDQRVLWLAQDIYARGVTLPCNEKFGTEAIARAAIKAAKVFFAIEKEG